MVPRQAHTPSMMFLKNQVEYAALDDELWELLQGPVVRNDYREAIIKKFLTWRYNLIANQINK